MAHRKQQEKHHDQRRRAFEDYLNKWEWSFCAGLTFSKPVSFQQAKQRAMEWLKRIKQHYPKTKFAAIVQVVKVSQASNWHVHVLIVDDRAGQRMLGIDPADLEKLWLPGCQCKVSNKGQWPSESMTHYLASAKNYFPDRPDNWDVFAFRANLLRELRDNPRPKVDCWAKMIARRASGINDNEWH